MHEPASFEKDGWGRHPSTLALIEAAARGQLDRARWFADQVLAEKGGRRWAQQRLRLSSLRPGPDRAVLEVLLEQWRGGAGSKATQWSGFCEAAVSAGETDALDLVDASLPDGHAKGELWGRCLFMAIRSRRLDSLEHLLALGADPDFKREGRPALMEAVGWSSEECCKALIEFGADVGARDAAGKTAMEWAQDPEVGFGGHLPGLASKILAWSQRRALAGQPAEPGGRARRVRL